MTRRLVVGIFGGTGLLAALIVTLTAGDELISTPKVVGIALATAAFVPVFLMLRSALARGEMNLILGTFIGGFFFKLLILLAGVWAGVSLLNWPMLELTIATLSFIFVFQLIESLYFWSRQPK